MVLKLLPSCKSYLWGGTKLKTLFNKSYEGDVLAETWELSCHSKGECTIAEGPYCGMTLAACIKLCGKQILGTNCIRFNRFPVLIKLIDAKENLSVQVHPDDAYAMAHEGQYGKTEMWYVAEADDNARLCCGFSRELTKEELIWYINHEKLCDVLKTYNIKKDDVFFIEAGTIHSIGAGAVIAEIQQSSDITYRVYDYGRRDPDNKLRPLHIQKALDVVNLKPCTLKRDFGGHLGKCPYFTVDKINAGGIYRGSAPPETFIHLLILEGGGIITDRHSKTSFRMGDSIFICAGTGGFSINGRCTALSTSIPQA